METTALWATVALLLTHELDAVTRHEWRMLPLISNLPDDIAKLLFIWAHIPLVLLVIWIATLGPGSIAAMVFSGFAIAHVGLHWLFRKHPENRFNNWPSAILILFAGLSGTAHLILVSLGFSTDQTPDFFCS